MDEARLLPDLQTFLASQASRLPDLHSRKWLCTGCSAAVYPKACDPKREFKRVAYFALPPKTHHEKGCNAVGFEKIVEAGERKPIQKADGLTGKIPAKVIFPDRTVVVPPGEGGLGTGTKNVYYPPPEGPFQDTGETVHRQTATTIRKISRLHAVIPDASTRKRLPLEVTGCNGSSYYDVFWQLQNIRDGQIPPVLADQVFYADLRFNHRPDYSNSKNLTLKLNRGLEKGTSHLYSVVLHWEEWRPQQRSAFSEAFEAQRLDVQEAYWGSDYPKPSAGLYFVGEQDRRDPLVFHVDDQRKLALIFLPNGMYSDSKYHKAASSTHSKAGTRSEWRPAPREGSPARQATAAEREFAGWRAPMAEDMDASSVVQSTQSGTLRSPAKTSPAEPRTREPEGYKASILARALKLFRRVTGL